MIHSKRISIIVTVVIVFALITSISLVIIGNIQEVKSIAKTELAYTSNIFDGSIISLEIVADNADWQQMLDNAISEQYIMVDVTVNGKKFQNVGIRPKGNSSLSQVASSESDRYSFRLQFDEYIKGQTCFGLESFVVNNVLGDSTYMKEYISYELMQEVGVDSPLFGFTDIKVNGEDWGLYLAVEMYDESYEQRVFGDTSGMLYNVKSMDMGGNQGESNLGGDGENLPIMPDRQNGGGQRPEGAAPNLGGDTQISEGTTPDTNGDMQRPEGTAPNSGGDMPDSGGDMPDSEDTTIPTQPNEENSTNKNFGGNGGRGSTGGSLEYTDDSIESYSAIFGNVVGKGTESDFNRIVQALKALSQGEDLESYFDVDQTLRYLAAHTIVVNLDSYSSSMAQNYYIYENDGQITILPWDYNLAWGGFQSGSASSVINFPIDTPLSGVEMSSLPLIEKLFENTEYLKQYHTYLQLLVDNYFANGKFEVKIKELDSLISDYVKNDNTAFCTYEEYKTAISAFVSLGNLRAESVQGQLDGAIPSTTAEQNANTSKLVSAGNLKLTDLGSMMGGKGNGNGEVPSDTNGQNENANPAGVDVAIDRELMSNAMNIIRQANGDITDEVKATLVSLGLTAEQIDQLSTMGGGRFEGVEQGLKDKNKANNAEVISNLQQGLSGNNLIVIGVLILALIFSLIFVSRFKKNY